MTDLLHTAVNGGELTRTDMIRLLELDDPEAERLLFQAAYQVKLRYVGPVVRLRGLIEISNRCIKNCYYCGIRRDNHHMHRFRMTEAEILGAARFAAAVGYGSVVLQSGERADAENTVFIERMVRRIKEVSDGRLGITLSLGEQTPETYRRWFAAGAHRYLLRIESSNPGLYAKMHPADHSFVRRVECLKALRECGYQVGTGVMSGLPGQTPADLADDILFFRDLDVDMIGMGPYIPHAETPMGRAFGAFDPAVQLRWGLRMIAVTRLVLRDVNIASTTALQALAPDGRERGLLAGANVIMPNIGDVSHRRDYLLYDNKPGTDENAAASRDRLERAIAAIGERIGYDEWGDSPHFHHRTGGSR